MLPFEITLLHAISFRSALPVDTPTVMSPSHVTFETVTLPVVTERAREPTEVSSAQIFPVLVLILTASRADAEQWMLPVLAEISTCWKEKCLGSSTWPVRSLIDSVLYSAFGR